MEITEKQLKDICLAFYILIDSYTKDNIKKYPELSKELKNIEEEDYNKLMIMALAAIDVELKNEKKIDLNILKANCINFGSKECIKNNYICKKCL